MFKMQEETYLPTSKSNGNCWDPNNAIDINRRLVYAACDTGIGREGMSTICSILNMPQPMSSESWNNHIGVLYDAHKEAIDKHLTWTRKNLREKLKKDNPGLLDDEIVDIAVTYDGTWSKRGHTASYGFGFVISVETGQVIDYGFRSKTCTSCKGKQIRIQINKKIGMINTNSIAQRTLMVAVVIWRCQLLKNYGNVH